MNYNTALFYPQVLSHVESEGASHEVRLWENKLPGLLEFTDHLKCVAKENTEIFLVDLIVTDI